MSADDRAPRHLALELWLVAVAGAVLAWVVLTEPLRRIAFNLAPIAVAAIFVLAFTGLGSVPTRALFRRLGAVDQALVSFALGLGLTAALVFTSGLLGHLERPLFAVWVLLGLGLVVPAAIAWVRSLRPWRPFEELLAHPLDRLAAAILVVFLLQLLPSLIAPVCSTDALEYHLMIPRIHLAEGRIGPIPTVVEAGYPALASYVYLPVMSLAGDVACKSLHFFAGLALVVAVGRLKLRLEPGGTRLLAPALMVSMPVLVNAMGVAWNDAFFVYFLVLALTLLVDAHGAEAGSRWRTLILAGLLTGLAAWTKYTIVMILLALAPLLLWAMARWRWRVLEVAAVAAPVGLISLAVFVKNLAFTGNPFYPFLHRVFPSPTWNDASAAYFSFALREWEVGGRTWLDLVAFPLHITLTPRLIDVHTGVMPLVLIPFLFVRCGGRGAAWLRGFVLCHVAAWLLIQTENRSLLTLLAVVMALAVSGLESALWPRPRLRRALFLVLILAAVGNLAVAVVNSLYMTEPLAYVIGRESRAEFLRRECPSYRTLEWLNQRDEVRCVLLVGLKRPYYLDRPGYFSAFADPPIAERMTAGATTVDGVAARLAANGVSHVVINRQEYDYDHEVGLYTWPEAQRQAFTAFIRTRSEPVVQFGPEVVYRLRSADAP